MDQIGTVDLLKAISYLIKRRDHFSLLQSKYMFYAFFGGRKKSRKLRNDALKAYIGLRENPNCFIFDGIKFVKTEEKFTEALVGMCFDIFLKDNYYTLKDNTLRENIQDELCFYFYNEGPYEINEVQIGQRDIVIDAGANMGMFSIMAAKKGARVYSFEPQSMFFNYLNENSKLNALEKSIKTYKLAISSHKYKTSLSVNQDNLLAASINIDRKGDFENANCISIDEWVKENQISKIDFIKADIEGAERLLLDGAENTIKQFKPKMAIATYHLPDDKEVLQRKILDIYPEYKIIQTGCILFAY